MNILMIHPHDIYSSSEPWTIRITSIANEFVKKGNNVKLAYFPLPKKERGQLRISRIIEYETIPFHRSKWKLFYNIKKMVSLGKWADIIHFQKCFPIASLPALFSAYANNKQVHYDWDDWEYGIYMFAPPSRLYGWYLRAIENMIPRLVDSMSVASDELARMAIKRGFSKKNLTKVNVCSSIERFNKKINEKEIFDKLSFKKPIVTYVGQLHGAQYADLLIKAAPLVLKECPQANFLIVGGGADLPRLKSLSEKLGLKTKIIFTGFASYDDVTDYLKVSDVAVACFEDTMQVRCKSPLKITEYMCAGKAIVASSVGEIPWMAKDCATLVKPGDIDSLAQGIITLLSDEELRRELESKAKKRAKELLRWEIVAGRLLELYEKNLELH